MMQSLPSYFAIIQTLIASLIFLPIVSASPVPYSDANMADIEKLRARGVPEVLYYLSRTLALFSYPPIHHQYSSLCSKFLILVYTIPFRAFHLSTSLLNTRTPTLIIPAGRNQQPLSSSLFAHSTPPNQTRSHCKHGPQLPPPRKPSWLQQRIGSRL